MVSDGQLNPRNTNLSWIPVAVVAVLILILAVWVRLWGLGARDLWLDENCTFYWVHYFYDWPTEGPDPRTEPAHLPYFFLLNLWTRFADEAAISLRGFSVFWSCATVLGLGVIAGRWVGWRIGLMSMALLAAHPLHIVYSQEARSYSLWVFEILLLAYVVAKAVQSGRWRWWLVYIVLAWLAVLTHYYTVFGLPATMAGLVIAQQGRRFLKQWFTAYVVLGLALLPVIWFLVLPYLQTGAKGWHQQAWIDTPPLMAIPKSLWALLPSGGYPEYLGQWHAAASEAGQVLGSWARYATLWAPAILITGCVLTAIGWPAGRNNIEHGKSPDDRSRSYPLMLYFLCTSILFLGTAWIYALFAGTGYLVGRYDVATLPTLVPGMVLLIDRTANRMGQSQLGRNALKGGLLEFCYSVAQ